MNKEVIGRRLAQLRDELAGPGEEKWTQARVGVETGLTQNMLGRLETAGAGTIDAFVAYLLFFQNRGYNLNWILAPDNYNISKLMLSDNTKAVDLRTAVSILNDLRQVIDREVAIRIKMLEE